MLLRPGGGEEEKTRAMAMTTSTTTATTGHGYCFSDTPVAATATTTTEFQSFDDDGDDDSNQQQIYGLTTTGMEMIGVGLGTVLIPKHHQTTSETNSSIMWKDLFGKTSSSNHQGGGPSAAGSEELIYQQTDFSAGGENTLMVDNRVILDGVVEEEEEEQEQDPSLRCLFTCQGNERPSQGLSLSLGSSSNNLNSSTTIGLQSFELRQPPPPPPPPHHHHQDDLISFFPSNSRDDGFFDKSINIQQQQMIMMMQAGAGINHHHHHQVQFHIRSSKYLGPAQELLNEFCNLGSTKQNDTTSSSSSSKLLKLQKNNQWQQQQQQHQDQENAPTNTSTKILQQSPNFYSLDLLELQKRKTKLLQMLDEVNRRYKNYCNQMRAVVASFESVAGNGTAFVYSALALKAMSKHFRCLKDGIVTQIKATKKALGEKADSTTNGAPGTTRGETPRLRFIDQTLRQQKAFQQMSMMESHPWRPQRGLPERAVSVLRAWLFEHFLHPYPSDVDKHILARQTGLSRSQVSNWFINARVRLWKPMVEEMYVEETKECDNMGSSDGEHYTSMDDTTTTTTGGRRRQNLNVVRTDYHYQEEEEKPTPDQLVRIDSECLSSIINSNNNNNNNINNPHEKNVVVVDDHDHNHHHHLHSFGRVTDSFGAMELDFSSYNHHQQNIRGGGGGGGGNVSLTLGLQQHGNTGVSLAFSSPTSQNSLFFGREQPIVEDCSPANVVHHHHHQYSLLDSEAQNLPYRNLLGAQLLHDLAG